MARWTIGLTAMLAMAAGCAVDPRAMVEPPEDSVLFNEGLFAPLHLAAARGDAGEIHSLLAAGADVNARSAPDELTPLYYAATGGHGPAVQALLAAGADLQAAGRGGDTAFHAAARGEPAMFRTLMAAGAAKTPRAWEAALEDVQEYENEPLLLDLLGEGTAGEPQAMPDAWVARIAHWAIGLDRENLAMAAVRHCRDANARGPKGNTLLHETTYRRWHDAMRLLIDHGADTNADGPLRVAVENDDQTAVEMLLNAKADPNERGKDRPPLLQVAIQRREGEAIARLLMAKGADVNAADEDGCSVLHATAGLSRGSFKTERMRLLLEKGADPRVRDRWGRTILCLWLGSCDPASPETVALTGLLLAKGADPNAAGPGDPTPLWQVLREAWYDPARALPLATLLVERGAALNVADLKGDMPAHCVVCFHEGPREALLRLVTGRGANVNARDKEGRTPLLLAVRRRAAWALPVLLERKADVNLPDPNSYSPLHLAATGEDAGVMDLLLAARPALEAAGPEGVRPLHVAAHAKADSQAASLIKAGANVNAVDARGRTPLHLAALAGAEGVVKLLIAANADVNARDAQGQTPLDWAQTPEMRAVLKAGGGQSGLGEGRIARVQPPAMPETDKDLSGGFHGDGEGDGITCCGAQTVLIVDRSVSLRRDFEAIRREMGAMAAGQPHPEHTFAILAMEDGPPRKAVAPDGGLLLADDAAKRRGQEFLRGLSAGGRTRLVPALEEAFRLVGRKGKEGPASGPRLIYVLTDGRFTDRHEVVAAVLRLRAGLKEPPYLCLVTMVRPPTPAIEMILRRLAKLGEGEYRLVELK